MSSGLPGAFFEQLADAYETAEAASAQPLERFYRVAGCSVRLRFAGPALLPHVTRALAHLAIAPVTDPALTICIWDSCSTRTPIPSPAWGRDSYRSSGDIRGFTNERFYTGFQLGAAILGMVDLERGLGLYWIRSADQMPSYETAAPLRLVLYPWLHARGTLAVHAAAVGTACGGVLLAGQSGSGKSTTALSCLESSLFHAADDFCLVRREHPLEAFSLYNSAKVHVEDLPRLPRMVSMYGDGERRNGDKAVVFLHEHHPGRLISRFPVKAIFIPRVTGQPHTELLPSSPAAALSAMTAGTLLLLPHAARDTFQSLSAIVRQIPSYELRLGADLDEIPTVIDRWLADGHDRSM